MSKSVLLVGTRKGLFVLESGDRREWSVRGPYCESWPIYHATLDHDSGTIYAAAASEWLGPRSGAAPTWASRGRTRAKGIGYPDGDGGLRLSKVSNVVPAHGRLLVGAEVGGAVREHRRRRDLLARHDVRRPGGPRGLERPSPAAARPPRPLCDHPAPGREGPLLGDRPGLQPLRDDRRWRDVGAAQQGAAPGLAGGLRGDRLLRPQGRARSRLRANVPAEPRRNAPQRRRGQDLDGDHGGLPSEFGFAAATHPHDRDTFYVIPLDPGHGRTMPDGQGSGLAHPRRRLELAAPRPGAAG